VTDTTPAVVVESSEATTIIHFNRPADRNLLSRNTLRELQIAIANIPQNTAAVVFTGSDDVFASGAHIRELQQLKADQALEFSTLGQQLFDSISRLNQVSIAAINGYCMGGALDLALACDIRVASSRAVFAHPGTRLGIITGWGGTQRLPRIVGRTRALELLLTARRIDSREAKEMGLVTRVTDPVLDYALELSKRVEMFSTRGSSAESISFRESD
jgi:enoyl-CoA hydratase